MHYDNNYNRSCLYCAKFKSFTRHCTGSLAHSLTVLYYLCAYNMRMLPKLQHLINVNKTRQNIVVLVIILS